MQDIINVEKKEMRKILLNGSQPKEYCTNKIKTAKYNWITFIPLSIVYQFNNYFNVFFLLTAILLSIKIISPMDPEVAIFPFLFVIGIGVITEGVEFYVNILK
jgi:UDP-N-acetylglucosamine:LPS N-acetylglucosamine transferase